MEPFDRQDIGLLLIAIGISEFPLILFLGMRSPRVNRAVLFLSACLASAISIGLGTLFVLGKL
ncbi:MAG: hypothetical protein AB1758_36850 [Candidatus Eremiobacterota bacterium]